MKTRRKLIVAFYILTNTIISSVISASTNREKVLPADGVYISTQKIRNDGFSTSIPEIKNRNDDFKPSSGFSSFYSENNRISQNTNKNTSGTGFLEQLIFPQRKLKLQPSTEIRTHPPTVIELILPLMQKFSKPQSTKGFEGVNKIGQNKGQTISYRSKGPQVYYAQPSSHIESNHIHDQPAHEHFDTYTPHHDNPTPLIFPENEISNIIYNHHPVVENHDHEIRSHHPEDYNHDHPHHHIPVKHLVHSTPPVYHSGISHDYSDAGFRQAVSKALQFWVPTALLLTGASVLFPQRVKVPTNIEDIRNRPKRSTAHHQLPVTGGDDGDGTSPTISAVLLRREHRSGDSNAELIDYGEDVPSPYFQHPESQRLNTSRHLHSILPVVSLPSQPLNHQEIPTSVPVRAFERVISKSEQRVGNQRQRQIRKQTPYDAFTYQSLENLKIGGTGSNDYIQHSHDAEIPIKKSTTSKPLTSVTTKEFTNASSEKSKSNGRKVRITVRSRKNNSSVSATESTLAYTAVHPSTVASLKDVRDYTITQKIKSTEAPANQISYHELSSTPQATTVNIAATSSSQLATSFIAPETAFVPVPVDNNTTRTSKRFASNLSQGNSELLQLLSNSLLTSQISSNVPLKGIPDALPQKHYDLSPDGPILGLLTSVVQHENESEACQKRALCELAIKGTDPKATRFETFMWSIATLVPDAFTMFYDLDDTFKAIREKNCSIFACARPNLDIQEQ